jgi:uncharacterized protein (DUF4213/DUF364 family)
MKDRGGGDLSRVSLPCTVVIPSINGDVCGNTQITIHSAGESLMISEKVNSSILSETIDQIRSVLGEEMASITVERVVIGLFFTGVKLSNGSGGICFTPVKEIPEAVCCPSSARAMPNSGKLKGQPVSSYLDKLAENRPLEKAMSIAVLNALSATCWRKRFPQDYTFELGADPVDKVAIPDGARAVVIGALVPYLKMLKERKQPFHILEKDPRTLKADELPYFVPPEKAHEVIPQADLLIITGTTVLNDTLEGILAQVKPGAEVILVGPTASMLPDAFFRRGVKSIGSITVTDPDKLLDVLAEAGSGYHFYGKSAERLVVRRGEEDAAFGSLPCHG